MGMAVGAAMRGLRPVVELMYDDFATECADPLFNQAAKIRYMTGGQCSVPMVLRAPMGARPPERRPAFPVLGEFLLPLPGTEGGGPLHRCRRQGPAEVRYPGRRPGSVPGTQAAVRPQGGRSPMGSTSSPWVRRT